MADWRWYRGGDEVSPWPPDRHQVSVLAGSAAHHGARSAGALLGAHADRLPRSLVARLSLEGRS